jgi:hypothetical protein
MFRLFFGQWSNSIGVSKKMLLRFTDLYKLNKDNFALKLETTPKRLSAAC